MRLGRGEGKGERGETIVNGRVWEVIVKAGCSVNEAPTPIPRPGMYSSPDRRTCTYLHSIKHTVSRVHRPESMHFRPSPCRFSLLPFRRHPLSLLSSSERIILAVGKKIFQVII